MARIVFSARRAGWAAGYHSVRAYNRWLAGRNPVLHTIANALYAIYEDLYQDPTDASGVRTAERRAA